MLPAFKIEYVVCGEKHISQIAWPTMADAMNDMLYILSAKWVASAKIILA